MPGGRSQSVPKPADPRQEDADPIEPPANTATDPPARLGEAQEQFGFELYRRFAERDPHQSFVYSPLSLAMAMTMTYLGARGDTAEEIRLALRLPKDRDIAREWYRQWLAWSFADRHGDDAVMSVRNHLWIQREFRLVDAYVELMKRNFFVGWSQIDCTTSPKAARETRRIQQYVQRSTHGAITEFPLTLDTQVRLVITNTLWLKVAWERPFDPKQTVPQAFQRIDGKSVLIPTMHGTLAGAYGEFDDVRVGRIPYRSVGRGEWELIVALPPPNATLDDVERSLRKEPLEKLVARLEPARLSIAVPKTTIRSGSSVDPELRAMGIRLAFDAADFSGMAQGGVHLDSVVHAAKIAFHEHGTDAAAATGAKFVISDEPQRKIVDLTLDRPFVFLLRERHSRSVAVMGRMLGM